MGGALDPNARRLAPAHGDTSLQALKWVMLMATLIVAGSTFPGFGGGLHEWSRPLRGAEHRGRAAPRGGGFRRFALLLTGEVRNLREGLSSQLALYNATPGGFDIYAVLSPTTPHFVRPGIVANETADAAEVAWLRTLPGLRALRLVPSNITDGYIADNLPGFPWAPGPWPWGKPRNTIAMLLKFRLVWQLMEETLRAAGAAAHRYDVLVRARPDVVTPYEGNGFWHPHGIDMSDYAPGKFVSFWGEDNVPAQPDSWAWDEPVAAARQPLPRVFLQQYLRYWWPVSTVTDYVAWGDWEGMRLYSHALDYVLQLCTGELGGPEGKPPASVDPGFLLAMGMKAGAREATRRARLKDPAAKAFGLRILPLQLRTCLGKDGDPLSGCSDSLWTPWPVVPVPEARNNTGLTAGEYWWKS